MAYYGKNRRIMRAKPRIQILRGNYLTEPGKLTLTAAPVTKDGEVQDPWGLILSGMAIVFDDAPGDPPISDASVTKGFRLAEAADAPLGGSIYIAVHDYEDHDVQESGRLVGLDCSDHYVVQTGYFDPAETWAIDDNVTVGDGGIFKKAVAGDFIVGRINRIDESNVNGVITVPAFTPLADDMQVIEIKTGTYGKA